MAARWTVLALLVLAPTTPAEAQQEVQLARGHSTVVTHPIDLERVLITDPEVADAVPVTPTEVVINGKMVGSTSLLLWGIDGTRAAYTIKVVPNVQRVQEELARLFPGQDIQAVAAGDAIVLTGQVRETQVASRALRLATSLGGGAEIVDHIAVPDRAQILLQVRLAEVSRSAVQQLGATLMRVDPLNPRGADEAAIGPGRVRGLLSTEADVTLSDAVNFYLFHRSSQVSAFIQALRNEGAFRSLAEPNLLAFPGEEASFLAGGEFPYPIVQGQTGAVTVEFKEFGVRLNFTPDITNSGAIRLLVAPEVSQLDFAGGLQLAGFTVPALLSRRAETVVELQEGQTFAIAGLMDSQMSRSVAKVPLLGDIPILGALFRSQEIRDNQTELLVLVTPHLVRAQDTPPPLPTGEPEEWNWDRFMRGTGPSAPPSGGEDGQPGGEGGGSLR